MTRTRNWCAFAACGSAAKFDRLRTNGRDLENSRELRDFVERAEKRLEAGSIRCARRDRLLQLVEGDKRRAHDPITSESRVA